MFMPERPAYTDDYESRVHRARYKLAASIIGGGCGAGCCDRHRLRCRAFAQDETAHNRIGGIELSEAQRREQPGWLARASGVARVRHAKLTAQQRPSRRATNSTGGVKYDLEPTERTRPL